MTEIHEMLKMAQTVLQRAYAPYSKFKVGCCIKSTTSKFYVGCNVENASYSLTCCAETNAISHMIAGGDNKIAEVMLVTEFEKLCFPCGACLQRFAEFATPNMLLHLGTVGKVLATKTLTDLLPFAFTLEGY